MAQRPARYVSSRRRKRSGLRPSSEHWLLLLGAVVAFAVIVGWVTDVPWPTETTTRHRKPRLTMAQARASNALVPIATAKRRAAPPFRSPSPQRGQRR